jgi:hypothetical protein
MELADAVADTFSSTHSLYDYDITFWDPLRTVNGYNSPHDLVRGRKYKGQRWLSSHDSAVIQRDALRRSKEFVEFLKLGRTLVVFLPGDLTVSVETGEFKYSGTGRNRHTTTLLKPFDILDAALPIDLRREFATGVEMEPLDSSIGPLYRESVDYWQYGCLIESDYPLHPLLRVTGTTKITAAEATYEKGRIIFLPLLFTHEEGEEDVALDDDDPPAATSGSEDGKDAESDSAVTAGPGDLVDDLVRQWLIARITTEEVAWPDWINEYRFQSELDRAPTIEVLEAQAAEIQKKLDDLTVDQHADNKWKTLVAAGGTPLEFAVAEALTVLGFDLEPVAPGRTDVRGTRDGSHVVVETKGVTKSAAESHCAQLEKWVAEEMVEERTAKGLLVINAWLNKPPLERTQPAFPPQMRRYAEQRNHCLVTGLQLLNLARTALAEPERADELASLLVNTTGVLDGWDDPTAVFSETPDKPVVAARAKGSPRQPRSSKEVS